jgi:thioredoxin reductase (NADPH)
VADGADGRAGRACRHRLVEDTIVRSTCAPPVHAAPAIAATSTRPTRWIICTGAQARWLGLPSEEKLRGFGVSACATCDGFFFRGKTVAVVGGGNTAVEEALYLTNHASQVTLIHRRDTLRADKTNQARPVRASQDQGDLGQRRRRDRRRGQPAAVLALKLRNLRSGATASSAIDGLFVAIGHTPATELFKGQLEMDRGLPRDAAGFDGDQRAGVFAAGDVKDKVFRQAVTAAGMGCMGALEAERFLAHHVRGVAAGRGVSERANGGGAAHAPAGAGDGGGTTDGLGQARIFHAVAEAGSFTHAGDTLNLSQSAVSRQISALEDSLQAPLFHRHARGLILTEQGEMLYRHGARRLREAVGAEARLAESREKPVGAAARDHHASRSARCGWRRASASSSSSTPTSASAS